MKSLHTLEALYPLSSFRNSPPPFPFQSTSTPGARGIIIDWNYSFTIIDFELGRLIGRRNSINLFLKPFPSSAYSKRCIKSSWYLAMWHLFLDFSGFCLMCCLPCFCLQKHWVEKFYSEVILRTSGLPAAISLFAKFPLGNTDTREIILRSI